MKIRISDSLLIEELKTKSPNEIASLYGYHQNGIASKIRKLGIKRSKHEHLINHNYFKNWSADMAYILGFVFADGSINTDLHHNALRIELKNTDVKILEFIRDKIQPTKKIYNYTRYNKKTKLTSYSSMLCFSSIEIIKDLKILGCVERKSYKEIRVPKIPEEFQRSFIRGYFDGDGSINCKNNNLRKATFAIYCSSVSFLEDIKNIINYGKISTCESPAKLSITNHAGIKSLYNYMYNEGFCLQRKYTKYTEIIENLKIPYIRKIRKDKKS